MKRALLIGFLFCFGWAQAQTDEQKLTAGMKEFHQALVQKNLAKINERTDISLSYGHSNGWIETRSEVVKNIETGYLDYRSYKEDSLTVTISGDAAHIRFIAEIDVTMNKTPGLYHLKVLEVWVRKGERWLLFARQAVRSTGAQPVNSNRSGFYKAYETKENISLREVFFKGENKKYYIEEVPAVGSAVFRELSYKLADSPGDMNVLSITLDESGIELFRKLTEKNLGQHIALIMNGETVLVAKVASVISTGELSILSDKSESELKDLVAGFKNK